VCVCVCCSSTTLSVCECVRLDPECKLQIQRTTARRWLRQDGYASRVPQVGPFIKRINEEQRRGFHTRHWRHSPAWWTPVCFTDSTAVGSEHVPNPRNERQWCRPGEHPRPLKKKGMPARKIHVYGASTKWGMVGPIFFEGTINSYRYINIILPKLLDGIADVFDNNNDKTRWSFQQGALLCVPECVGVCVCVCVCLCWGDGVGDPVCVCLSPLFIYLCRRSKTSHSCSHAEVA